MKREEESLRRVTPLFPQEKDRRLDSDRVTFRHNIGESPRERGSSAQSGPPLLRCVPLRAPSAHRLRTACTPLCATLLTARRRDVPHGHKPHGNNTPGRGLPGCSTLRLMSVMCSNPPKTSRTLNLTGITGITRNNQEYQECSRFYEVYEV